LKLLVNYKIVFISVKYGVVRVFWRDILFDGFSFVQFLSIYSSAVTIVYYLRAYPLLTRTCSFKKEFINVVNNDVMGEGRE